MAVVHSVIIPTYSKSKNKEKFLLWLKNELKKLFKFGNLCFEILFN
jgi:hypothetical protein